MSDGRPRECMWRHSRDIEFNPYAAAQDWVNYIDSLPYGPHSQAKVPLEILREILKDGKTQR